MRATAIATPISTTMVVEPPNAASSAPPTTGASGIVLQLVSMPTDCTRPSSSGGVIDIL